MFNEKQNQNKAPAEILTQTQRHETCSNAYSVITSMDIINHFQSEGFTYGLLNSRKSRRLSQRPFAKHMFYLEREGISFGKESLLKEMKPRIIGINSYDRTSSFQLFGGMYRGVCDNGLIMSWSIFAPVRIRHIHLGDTPNEILLNLTEQVNEVGERFKKVHEHIDLMKETKLSNSEKEQFALKVLEKRFERLYEENKMIEINNWKDILIPNRLEDSTNSAWHVLNTVQENTFSTKNAKNIVYRYKSFSKENQEVSKERTARRVTALEGVSDLNRFLFDAMNEFLPKSVLSAA